MAFPIVVEISNQEAVAYWKAGILPNSVSNKVVTALNKISDFEKRFLENERIREIEIANEKNIKAKALNRKKKDGI